MIYALSGTLVHKAENYAVIDVGGVAFKVNLSLRNVQILPQIGSAIKLSTYLHVREDLLAIYGFSNDEERDFFERLNSISGIGPKSALGILSVAPMDQLVSAINEGRVELLTKASGVGKKIAERVVLELKGKLTPPKGAQQAISLMESDLELEETLTSLGYSRQQAKAVVSKIDPKITGFKERLKEALRRAKS